jgi:broad specificity phosphatase PhoE
VGDLLLLRHGESTWNAAGLWQGWYDAPLSGTGQAQAVEAGRALARSGVEPDLVVSSDLRRARRTAELVADQLGYRGDVLVAPELREQDVGEWCGLTQEEVKRWWPEELRARKVHGVVSMPGGEDADGFVQRVMTALGAVAGRGAALALVVAHGGVVAALERALGLAVGGRSRANLAGWWLQADAGRQPGLRIVRPALPLAAGEQSVAGPA